MAIQAAKGTQAERRKIYDQCSHQEERIEQLSLQCVQRREALSKMSIGLRYKSTKELEDELRRLDTSLHLPQAPSAQQARDLAECKKQLQGQRLQVATFENQAARLRFDLDTDLSDMEELKEEVKTSRQAAQTLKPKETEKSNKVTQLATKDEELTREGQNLVDQIIKLQQQDHAAKRAAHMNTEAVWTKRQVWQRVTRVGTAGYANNWKSHGKREGLSRPTTSMHNLHKRPVSPKWNRRPTLAQGPQASSTRAPPPAPPPAPHFMHAPASSAFMSATAETKSDMGVVGPTGGVSGLTFSPPWTSFGFVGGRLQFPARDPAEAVPAAQDPPLSRGTTRHGAKTRPAAPAPSSMASLYQLPPLQLDFDTADTTTG